MATEPFDPIQYKATQRQRWNTMASGWRKWWDNFERGAQPLSDRLVELAEVQPGQRVLDIATGLGEPALTAARRMGPAGHVVAVDQSPQMLAVARERAAALGLGNVELREMDAEALDLPKGSFDAVLCRWALMLLPNLAAALGGMRQVLVEHGRFAAAVWGESSKVPWISLPTGIVRQLTEAPPPPAGTPGPFNLADTSVLEQTLRQAGFADVRSEGMTVTMEWPSFEVYLSFLRDVGPLTTTLAEQPIERQERVWKAIADAAGQYTAADGSVRMPNQTICVVGRRSD